MLVGVRLVVRVPVGVLVWVSVAERVNVAVAVAVGVGVGGRPVLSPPTRTPPAIVQVSVGSTLWIGGREGHQPTTETQRNWKPADALEELDVLRAASCLVLPDTAMFCRRHRDGITSPSFCCLVASR